MNHLIPRHPLLNRPRTCSPCFQCSRRVNHARDGASHRQLGAVWRSSLRKIHRTYPVADLQPGVASCTRQNHPATSPRSSLGKMQPRPFCALAWSRFAGGVLTVQAHPSANSTGASFTTTPTSWLGRQSEGGSVHPTGSLNGCPPHRRFAWSQCGPPATTPQAQS